MLGNDDNKENQKSQENITEQKITGADIDEFSRKFLDNTASILDGKPLSELYSEGTQKQLAERIIPTFQIAAKDTVEQSQKLIPKEPLYKIIWALTAIKLSDNALALDRYTGYSEELDKLHTLSNEQTIQVSTQDLEEVGRILGNLVAHHALVGRPISELKPNLGDLEDERSKLLTTSKDRLQLLDTILDKIKTKK